MFERFTAAARTTVVTAQEQARDLGHEQIAVEHLALGLLADPAGVAATVLSDAGVDAAALRREVAAGGGWDTDALSAIGIDLAEVRRRAEAAFGPGALGAPRPRRIGLLRRARGGHLPLTAGAKRVLERALRETVALRHTGIGSEHLLLGLLADGQAVAGLRRAGLAVDPAEVRARVLAALRAAA